MCGVVGLPKKILRTVFAVTLLLILVFAGI